MNTRFDQVKVRFEKFLASMGAPILSCERERALIQNKLRRHFNTASSDYLCSKAFSALLDHIYQIFVEKKHSTKYFTLLASFDEHLRKHSIKRSSVPPPATTVAPTNENHLLDIPPHSPSSIADVEPSLSEIQETIDDLLERCTTLLANESTPVTKREKKTARLERRLHRLSRLIRELEETDMSLDDMANCDLYLVESNLKKQAFELYTKLAHLKRQPSTTERILHQPISLPVTTTDHPLVSKDLEDMVNQAKYFPSFGDVLRTVERANEAHSLDLDTDQCRTVAERFFKIIGDRIKTRRMADFHQVMSSRLPENFNIDENDPALTTTEIERVLSKNQREALIKTEQILEEYSLIEAEPDEEMHIECHDDAFVVDSDEHEDKTEAKLSIAFDTDNADECQYDVADIIPPLSIESLPGTIDPSDEKINDRTFTCLPDKDPVCDQPTTSDTPVNDDRAQVLTARRRQAPPDNEIIYKLYTQRLTTDTSAAQRRMTSNDADLPARKRSKNAEPELIVLD